MLPCDLAVRAENVPGLAGRIHDTTGDHRAHLVEAVPEGGDHPEVPSPTPQRPEEIGMLVGGGGEQIAGRGDDIGGEQVVARQAVPAVEPAEATAEGETGDPGHRDHPHGGGEPERLGLVVELREGEAGLRVGGAPHRVDPDALHRREVEHHAALADGGPGHAMASRPNGQGEIGGTRELHAPDDVGDAGAADDHRRAPVDHAVEHGPGPVVRRVAGKEHLAADVLTERAHGHGVRHGDHCIGKRAAAAGP
jgi:hypothetical protein